ncbi:hypothetical protein EDD16DRAFT_1486229, partial [Pisolithus croceorrhizus]
GEYLKWLAENGFTLMLPNVQNSDTKMWSQAHGWQSSLEEHLVERGLMVQFSESTFHGATISWLIETDQPIHTLQHPSFSRMVEIASHARNGIKILNH